MGGGRKDAAVAAEISSELGVMVFSSSDELHREPKRISNPNPPQSTIHAPNNQEDIQPLFSPQYFFSICIYRGMSLGLWTFIPSLDFLKLVKIDYMYMYRGMSSDDVTTSTSTTATIKKEM